MKRSNETLIDFCYRLLQVGVFLSAVICFFSVCFERMGTVWKHFAVMFLTVVLFFAFRKLNKRQRIYTFLFMVSFLVIFFGATGREKFAEWIFAGNSLLWTAGLAVFVCALHLLSEKYFFLKISFVAVLYALLLYALFTGRHVPKMGVVLLALYVVMTLTEYVRINSRERKKENSHAYLVWMAPFLALYFGILCLMPAPETPYSWQWLKNIYLRAEEKVSIYVENYINRNSENLDGAVTGFSEEASLFSGIASDNKNIMVIETSPGKKQPLYLTGKIYDSFDGREWKSTGEGYDRERLLDTLETVCALNEYGKSQPEHPVYYNHISIKAEYRHLHTGYLLVPSKTWETEGRFQYQQSGADLVFERQAGYGTEYTFRYCRINMGRRAMRDFLQSGLSANEDAWEDAVRKNAEAEIPYTELPAYRESIRERYGKETAVSPETKGWVADVTKEAEDEIDRLFCIEAALSDMKYNTNPGGLPEKVTDEQSFLDYFLTENPEGFCSYYATAFVLLARAEGFPARYVQGFCIPLGNAEETEVYSDMAHAWPEVYLEGRGWIPFEPTPGYGVRRYLPEEEEKESKDGIAQIQEPEARESVSDEMESAEEQEEEKDRKTEELRRVVSYIAIGVLLILVTGMLVFVIDRLCEKYREKRRSLGEKYRRAVLRNLQILTMLGYEREPSETYHELVERIREKDDGDAIPTAFLETYESILYGTREAGEPELEECLERRKQLISALRKNKGKRYLLYWIRLNL